VEEEVKKFLKAYMSRLSTSRLMRRIVANLVYPAVARCLRDEIQADVASPSGIAEALAWKTHAYLVLNEELRPTGRDCSGDRMRHDGETRQRLLDMVLSSPLPDGDILEFGVYRGESLLYLADRCPERRVYGFDSFEGLPDDWWARPKGFFKTEPPLIDRSNLRLVKGLFHQSLPRFLTEWSGRAALIHVDCVLYESTRACLLPILPRCQIGTVLIFDEYYNYPDFAHHEWLAWREVRADYKVSARCTAYDGRRVAFQITDLADSAERDPLRRGRESLPHLLSAPTGPALNQ
jgi:methyltransferase family protein